MVQSLLSLTVFFLVVFFSHSTFSNAQSPLPQLEYSLTTVLGQPNFKETQMNQIVRNRGLHLGAVHFDSRDKLYVFDSGNNRILGFHSFSGDNQDSDIVIGQPSFFESGTANGDNTRQQPASASTLATLPYPNTISVMESPRSMEMTTDANNNLYAVDLNNNRVLKYIDPFTNDQVADDVWGQPDFTSRQAYCGQSGLTPTASTLCLQWEHGAVYSSGVDIDAAGNLWVTDTGNHRVLRFPPGSKTADLVLGQLNFTSRTARAEFDTNPALMHKPVSVRIKPNTGEVYVLEGEEAGQSRIMVFTAPFTNGMAATRSFGMALSQTTQPANTSGWMLLSGRWVNRATGIRWARGMAFNAADPKNVWTNEDVWINDGGNHRLLLFNTSGNIIDKIGQPDLSSVGCTGNPQGYVQKDGTPNSLCQPDGEIGIDSLGRIYTSKFYHPRDVNRFPLPLTRNAQGQVLSDGWLLHGEPGGGWNQFSGKTFQNGYGMSISPNTNPPQLFITDGQRILVFNNYRNISTYQPADYIIGQDSPDVNHNNNGGIFNGVNLNSQTVGDNQLWVTAGDRIYAFSLPITGGGRNYQPSKTLYRGQYVSGNVIWADDQTKVDFKINGMAFDPSSNALWVSDSSHNRVLRIRNPLTEAVVDLVLGQSNKIASGDNASLGSTPNSQGFGEPWSLNFDRIGNLYVVDSSYEGWRNGASNRVMRFSSSSINPTTHNGNIFPLPSASGVYAKQNFTTRTSWGAGTPQTPTFVTFDSTNRMLLLTDSYGNLQYERAFMYASDHASQTTPQPSHILPVPFGQTSFAYFDPNDSHLIMQDHTWSRILFVNLGSSGDFNQNGNRDFADFRLFLSNFGSTNPIYNFISPSLINIFDFNAFVRLW